MPAEKKAEPLLEPEEREGPKKEVQMSITEDIAKGHYANAASITFTPEEFFLDFFVFNPNGVNPSDEKFPVSNRVIMAPSMFLRLMSNMEQSKKIFEFNFGKIRTPGESRIITD